MRHGELDLSGEVKSQPTIAAPAMAVLSQDDTVEVPAEAAVPAGGSGVGIVYAAQQPLVKYWRDCGFQYSDAEAAVIRQVKVRFGTRVRVYPADQVYRKAAIMRRAPDVDVQARVPRPWSTRVNVSARNAIVAPYGHVLLSVDYSQVRHCCTAHALEHAV